MMMAGGVGDDVGSLEWCAEIPYQLHPAQIFHLVNALRIRWQVFVFVIPDHFEGHVDAVPTCFDHRQHI